ncbi:MAG: FHA domain-containing protein, partial [Kiritimatiellae bacterium]|nr:FHA domain-containing protein [Kiritimatiellia bacterium]
AGAACELKPGETTLGRSRSATFRLLASDVSGLHAVVKVAGGAARLENLSQFGTRVDDQPVVGAVALIPGQRIAIGKVTVLRVDEAGGADAEAPTGGGHEPATRAADAALTVAAAPAPTRAAPSASHATAETLADDAFSELTRSMGGVTGQGGEAEEGATRAMQTRAATPEEIEHLQELERKRVRRRMTVGLSVAIPLVVLALIFRPRRPPPEIEIEWPKDAAGSYLDQFEPAPSGGYKEGGFDVCFPGNGTFKRKVIEGGMVLEGFIGRSLDVPMRVMVQEEREVRFAGLSRAAAVEDWMQQAAGSSGRWNFDRPSPTPAFFGRKNGIPYTRVTYLRDGDGTWFGVASVVLYGDRRLVARTEVPAAERMRAEKMMSVKLIRPSDAFEFAYWEGVPGTASLDESAMLRQIRADLERIAPATWAALESLLQTLLTQAVQAGHREVETEALALLVKLRERQALWFNSQKLAFDAAMMQNNWKKAEKVAEFTKAVYSRVEDQRYFDVRKWKAGP